MSYSRWGKDSYWYTFWVSTKAKKKEDEIFEICSISQFTYKQLVLDLNGCLMNVALETNCTFPQIDKLRGYMLRFIRDVDLHYLEEK